MGEKLQDEEEAEGDGNLLLVQLISMWVGEERRLCRLKDRCMLGFNALTKEKWHPVVLIVMADFLLKLLSNTPLFRVLL